MPDKSRKARAIPEEFLPLVEQGLLNLAVKDDIRIIRDGHDITKSLIAQAGRINKAYEDALNALRSKRSTQGKTFKDPEMSANPPARIKPKPVARKPLAPVRDTRPEAKAKS